MHCKQILLFQIFFMLLHKSNVSRRWRDWWGHSHLKNSNNCLESQNRSIGIFSWNHISPWPNRSTQNATGMIKWFWSSPRLLLTLCNALEAVYSSSSAVWHLHPSRKPRDLNITGGKAACYCNTSPVHKLWQHTNTKFHWKGNVGPARTPQRALLKTETQSRKLIEIQTFCEKHIAKWNGCVCKPRFWNFKKDCRVNEASLTPNTTISFW